MIFVTVGTQLPFDRMVKAIDTWAAAPGRPEVFAQIGNTSWRPSHIQYVANLTQSQFMEKAKACDILVAHAGLGSIITAMEFGKPIVIVPRLAQHGEHRNDHQLATARKFAAMAHVTVAYDTDELLAALENLEALKARTGANRGASPELLNAIRSFLGVPTPA